MDERILRQQQQQFEQQRREREERMRELQTKIKRCQEEIAWKIWPQNGEADIPIAHLEQAIKELGDAVREYNTINLREGSI